MPINSHRGEYIAKCLENTLLDWVLKYVFTITIDNASSNDVTVGNLRKKLIIWGASTVKCKCFSYEMYNSYTQLNYK